MVLVAIFALFTTTSCVVTPGPEGYYGEEVSPLPPVVELGADPYYYHSGFYYYYDNDSWRYSKSRSGPWRDLPRSHWPKEVRHKGGDHDRNWDHDHDRDRDRGDDRDRDTRHGYDR